MTEDLKKEIFNQKDSVRFSETALKIFGYQMQNNSVYAEYVSLLGRYAGDPQSIDEIPFLPAEFFKTRRIICEGLPWDVVFESSRTSGMTSSLHYVHDIGLYEESFLRTFRMFYGDPSEYFIASLLPSYTERKSSSLIYMVNTLVRLSASNGSRFYQNNHENLLADLQSALRSGLKTLLLGVSFALVDFAEKYSGDLQGAVIMETGGMKGRRKEVTREELHEFLKKRFNVDNIHSEYGMTELMSQAYSKGNGIFYCPPWMRILIRDPNDPLSVSSLSGKTGGINIIDLANLYSCPFIATGDMGRLHEDGGFEVLGRFDSSDIRGCNLLTEQDN